MNVFITGGAGFIGSHIARYHLAKKDRVWVVDDLSTGSLENLPEGCDRVDVADLGNYGALSEALVFADVIYHMAASVGQKRVLSQPHQTLLNNFQTCAILLEKAKPHHRILIASSASVYWHGVVESRLIENATLKIPSGNFPQWAYGISKLAIEALAQTSGLHCVIARFFNIYGARQKSAYGSVIPTFFEQAIRNLPMTVYGKGDQLRSFLYVEDAVRAMDLLLQRQAARGQIVNIGHDRLVSILELAEKIRQIRNSRSRIVHIPYDKAYGVPFEESLDLTPSFDKLKKITGFQPTWGLEEGLRIIDENLRV